MITVLIANCLIIKKFIILATIFMMIKGLNAMRKQEEEKPEEPPKPSDEVLLLQEIRDSLKK